MSLLAGERCGCLSRRATVGRVPCYLSIFRRLLHVLLFRCAARMGVLFVRVAMISLEIVRLCHCLIIESMGIAVSMR